jgi:hypothetical protein
MEDATKTTEQGINRIEEASKRRDKHVEMLREKVATDERDAKRGRQAENPGLKGRQAETKERSKGTKQKI